MSVWYVWCVHMRVYVVYACVAVYACVWCMQVCMCYICKYVCGLYMLVCMFMCGICVYTVYVCMYGVCLCVCGICTCICMYVCDICMCMHVCMCWGFYVHICEDVCVCAYSCVWGYINVGGSCSYVWKCVCVCWRFYVHVHEDICVCMDMQSHRSTFSAVPQKLSTLFFGDRISYWVGCDTHCLVFWAVSMGVGGASTFLCQHIQLSTRVSRLELGSSCLHS